ncbi:MAG TPA: heme exporter protein CcmB [Alphaproteobacteria bacterium]|nr:heme exporter protein CcmB [Alphaproteobacteria bacterium]
MTDFFRLLRHDLRLLARQPSSFAALLLFFVIVIILLPFAIGPEPDLLGRLAPGLVWLAALLMSLLGLEKLLVEDARDGTLDLLRQAAVPLPVVVFSRLGAETLMMLLALALMIPLAALLLNMNAGVVPVLLLSLLLGVPSLVLMGGMMAAVTVGLDRHPALLTLLLIPFYIPVLIFAVGACDAAALGADPAPHFYLLGAILALLLPTAPLVIAAALRQQE